MRRCIVICLAALLSCVFVIALLFLALLARWDWSLTTDEVTVFVNDVENVDDAVCTWSGNQSFDVTHDAARAIFYILAFESEVTMSALIDTREAEELLTESIDLRLVRKRADGNAEEVRIVPIRPTRIEHTSEGGVRSWSQEFRISEDLEKLSRGSISLLWSMDYRDVNGEIQTLSITVPLRREEIISPSSIVRSDPSLPVRRRVGVGHAVRDSTDSWSTGSRLSESRSFRQAEPDLRQCAAISSCAGVTVFRPSRM